MQEDDGVVESAVPEVDYEKCLQLTEKFFYSREDQSAFAASLPMTLKKWVEQIDDSEEQLLSKSLAGDAEAMYHAAIIKLDRAYDDNVGSQSPALFEDAANLLQASYQKGTWMALVIYKAMCLHTLGLGIANNFWDSEKYEQNYPLYAKLQDLVDEHLGTAEEGKYSNGDQISQPNSRRERRELDRARKKQLKKEVWLSANQPSNHVAPAGNERLMNLQFFRRILKNAVQKIRG